MNVLFVSSEIYPFAKSGGLADFSSCLVKHLRKRGVQVRAVMPLYRTVQRDGIVRTGKRIGVSLGERDYEFELYSCEDFLFLHNSELFDRDYLYGPPGWSYEDNDVRFGAFSKAVAQMLSEGILEADVVHSNDWQTALVPLFSKEVFRLGVRHLFTIHNLAYQGLFGKETMDRLGLPPYLFNMEAIEFWGLVNFLKAGIVFSDMITTVSPTYAKEIQTQEYGYGLEGVLRKYSHRLRGILNGIDYEVWNPETDGEIYVNFSSRNYLRKFENKRTLCGEFSLPPDKPLLSFINRFTHQKGVELILSSVEELSRIEASFFFLGTGEYQEAFREIGNLYENIRVVVGFDESLARKLYASSDFVLMPSLFEPCGLTQMIGMRYGCVPLVRKTGGLADTVIDVSEGGYGLLFEEPSREAFLCAVRRAVELYQNTKRFRNCVRRVMRLDFSCERMAGEYERLYSLML